MIKDFKVIIATKGRANKVTTLDLFRRRKNIYLFLDSKEEVKDYRHYNPDVNIVVSGKKGVAPTMNFAIDYFKKEENLIFACDDVRKIGTSEMYITGVRRRMYFSPLQLENFCLNAFKMLKEKNIKIFGISPANDGLLNLKYQISFYNFLVGSFWGMRNTKLFLNEELKRKHDYQYTIQHLLKFGKVLRFDCVMTKTDFVNSKGGGCEGTANDLEGKNACNWLIKHYPNYFSHHKTRKNEVKFYFSVKNVERKEQIEMKKLLENPYESK